MKKKTIEKFNKEYYREIQSLYSPLALGYIDNFNISKSELISEILYLQEKNSLEINDGKLISKYKVFWLIIKMGKLLDTITYKSQVTILTYYHSGMHHNVCY